MTSILTSTRVLKAAAVFGEPQLHTDGDVAGLTFAPDGNLWSIEETGIVRQWQAPTGQQLAWQSLSDLETLWCFSQDARLVASASDDLTLWDAASGMMLTAISQDSWVTAAAFPPDTTCLATGHDDGSIRFWDLSAHQAMQTWRHHKKAISAVAFRPDGKVLAAASEDKSISIWDVQTGALVGTLQGHTDRIPALAWHPSGKFLVSAGWDATARVWDMQSFAPIILLNIHAGQVSALAFARDGKLFATADSQPAVHIWDFDSKKPLHSLKDFPADVRAMAFHGDGSILAVNGAKQIQMIEPRSGRRLTAAGPSAGAKTTIALAKNGQEFASNGGGLAPRIWSVAKKATRIALDGDRLVHAMAFSPDGRWVAGAAGQSVRLWDAATGKVHADWDGPEEAITTLAFAPDGATLASASSSGLSVWLWRVTDGEPILLIPDALQGCIVEALAFHPDGQRLAVGGIDWLATGGSNGAVSLWNLPGRYEDGTFFDGTTALAFHPSGERLAFATLDHAIGIWDVASQQVIQEFQGHEATITSLAFSPDGRHLVSASEDRTLRAWTEDGDDLGAGELDTAPTSVAFSADGKHLFTGNANTTCYLLRFADLLEKKS